MNGRFMEKTTFAEICKLMKYGDQKDWECIQSIFDLALLFLPELVCPEVGLISNLGSGLDLLGAKSVIKNVGTHIRELFTREDIVNFTSQYERAQAAQVLMVFSAYFDSMQLYLPDESREIALSKNEKIVLTEKSLEEYKTWIEKRSHERASQETRELLEFHLDLRAPLETEFDYQNRLNEFYAILNKQFLKFFDRLSFGEQISDAQKDHFMAVLRNLPEIAVENYKKQYYELKTTVDAFRIWADTQEHIGLNRQIDVGFQKMSEQIVRHLETHISKGTQTLDKYAKEYADYIADKLVKTTEIDVNPSDDTVFPAKKDIFVPQSFKALRYKKNMLLESDKTWDDLPEMDEIGKFITDTLRHSATGNLPLLILGVPGAGKTLLCHMLAAQILSHEYHVIIIRLRDSVADDTIAQQINEQIERDFANRCTWEDIADHAMSKPILLIFDGYDELLQASGRTYADYVTKITEFQRQQRVTSGIQVKCILTSRTTLIDKASIPRGSTVIKLSDFDEERINRWTEIWNDTNRQYFERHQLNPFSVEPTNKVFELAKQPLLLLLLALYDTNGNALKKNAELTGAQLYDRLIREFIAREQRKDAAFTSFPEDDQNAIIEKEMNKVSVAALGMYNRRVLYIRAEELERDLSYLLPDSEDETKLQLGKLQKSEKLLGSFFFIHRSDSRGSIQQTETRSAAYEFLHNTFGEFLTANFIIVELYQNLQFISLLQQTRMIDRQGLNLKRQWFVGLSYAPLSSRPIVAKMVREWALNYFGEHGLDKDRAISAMHVLLKTEIDRVISGQDIFAINEVLSENGNPFEKRENLIHLACYSLNLLCLGTLACGDEYSFSCKNTVWDKLICLWRYAFPEGELLNFANIFRARRGDESCCLCYLPSEKEIGSSRRKIFRLAKIDQAIGDSLSSALISAILGDGDTGTTLQIIERNNLDISYKYLWNKCLSQLGENRFGKLQERTLLQLKEYCIKQGTTRDVLVYYILLNHLLKYRNKTLGYSLFVNAFEDGLRYLEKIEHFGYRYDAEHDLYDQLQQIVFCLGEQLPAKAVDWDSLIHFSFRSGSPETFLRLVSRLLKESTPSKKRKDEFLFIYREEISDVLRYYWDRILDNPRRMHASISDYLELTYQLLQFGKPNSFDRIFDHWHYNLYRYTEKMNISLSIEQQALMIRCLKLTKEARIQFDIWKENIDWMLSGITMRKVYRCSPEAAYDLCCLLEERMFLDPAQITHDLRWIVESYGDDISVKFYRKIYTLLKQWDNGDLPDMLSITEFQTT